MEVSVRPIAPGRSLAYGVVALAVTFAVALWAAEPSRDQAHVDKQMSANIPDVVAGTGCVLPQWLENESDKVNSAVVRLHALQKLDTEGYKKASPDDCQLKRLRYRVNVLDQLVLNLEKR